MIRTTKRETKRQKKEEEERVLIALHQDRVEKNKASVDRLSQKLDELESQQQQNQSQRTWEADTNTRVRCAIAAVTDKPLGKVLRDLVDEEPSLRDQIIPSPPTLERLLALKDVLLIPDHQWGEVQDTFDVGNGTLTAIRRY